MTHTDRSRIVVALEHRRAEVARMRREGATLDRIAAAVGCSLRTVQRDLTAMTTADRAAQAQTTAEHRAEALDDLRAVAERCWLELDGNPPPAAVAAICSTLIRAVERTAALTGADAPQRHVIAATEASHGSIAETYAKLPPRAIERARREMNAQLDRALELRAESDNLAADEIAAMRAEVTEAPEPEPAEVTEAPEPEPEPDTPDTPAPIVPADRRTARALGRAIERNAETDAAIRGFKRARNSATGADDD